MRRKSTKSARAAALEKDIQRLLKKTGYSGKPREPVNSIPDYRAGVTRMTSDRIPGNGQSRQNNVYTGDEIMGIATSHKSNLVPIRKDNKQAAIDVSAMRRN